ncbi:MAG: type II toxin-antitoxin system VapC family toxin [Bryobacteraceae bacterium]
MSRFVLDASSVLTWCFPDEHADEAQYPFSLLNQQDGEAVSTCFWPVEILNALLMGERRQRITQPLIQAFLADLRKLPVRLDVPSLDTSKVEALARLYRLTAYDAAYLELAQRLNLPLATLDKALLLAAPAAGVALLAA